MSAYFLFSQQNPVFSWAFIIIGIVVTTLLLQGVVMGVLIFFARKTKTRLDDKIIQMLKLPFLWTIFLLVFYFALRFIPIFSEAPNIAEKLLLTAVISIWAVSLIKLFDTVDAKIKGKKQEDGVEIERLLPLVETLIKILVLSLFVLLALKIWKIDLTPVLASAGIAGIALAFAAKDVLGNVFGTFSIFFDRPYKLGDYVLIKETYRGKVIDIATRSTKIKTKDNIMITLPNSVMVTDAVINETGFEPFLRIRIPFGVSYNSDLDKVENVLIETLKGLEIVSKKHLPAVRFRKLDPSEIKVEALATISSPALRGEATHKIIKAIYKAFNEENIEMPFPQRDIHIKSSTSEESITSLK